MTYDNLRLEKGMYGEAGKSFTQVLEAADPSDNYRGTPLEGLDAFQRQLKRFDIHVKGSRSDVVEKFFRTTESAVLFPEFVSRVVRQGMEEDNVLPSITAVTTQFDGMDYRSISSVPSEEKKSEAGGGGFPAASDHSENPEHFGKAAQERPDAGGLLRGDPVPEAGFVLCHSEADRHSYRQNASGRCDPCDYRGRRQREPR